jgi:uncharacterized hydrophobic protein (TIGR00341 family)
LALRLADVVVPEADAEELSALLQEDEVSTVGFWRYQTGEGRAGVRVLVASEATEGLLDRLADRFGGRDDFRVIILDVEATLPRHEEEDEGEEETSSAEPQAEEDAGGPPMRISREELYQDVSDASSLSAVYLVTVALSTIVAGAGLLRGDVAVIIGAMVIAPLLGPNVALSLAATLGDTKLGTHAGKTLGAGIATAFAFSVLIGFFGTVDPQVPELYAKSQVGFSDVAIALAAGAAGSLAFTTGLPAAIVGVMVAVALLPPLVATGLFVSSGSLDLAVGAAVLVMTNVACLNLAAIATFLAQKVEPRTWWEAEKAKRATRIALGTWLALAAVLVGVILLLRD